MKETSCHTQFMVVCTWKIVEKDWICRANGRWDPAKDTPEKSETKTKRRSTHITLPQNN